MRLSLQHIFLVFQVIPVFLSLRVFGLLSSSLLLFPQRFGHIGQNVVEIAIKMKIIVRKPLMIKIIKLHLKNSDN